MESLPARRPERASRSVRLAAAIAIAGITAALVTMSFVARGDAAPIPPLPATLSATGLFAEGARGAIAPGVLAFSPQYPLWSDGATKRRWVRLPQGSVIDATDPDAWVFPRGTRFWKEFSMGGRPVETRMIERLPDGSWRFAAYVWNEAGTDATLAPTQGVRALPVAAAPGGRYTIPGEPDCRACHEGAPVPVLGFGALQLSADRDPLAPHAEPALPTETAAVDLHRLVESGLVRNLPAALATRAPRVAAATREERAALGYLHANCAHCHSAPESSGAAVPVDLVLAQSVADPQGSAARIRSSMQRTTSRFRASGDADASLPVVAGHPERSLLALRMRSRDPRIQMPPLGTTVPDVEALALIDAWISRLSSDPTARSPEK